jgi:xylulokinase
MYIGLDLGTSGLKGVLIDDAQAIRAEARRRWRSRGPMTGGASRTRPPGSLRPTG